jgi:hypothetical protein
VKNYLAEMVDLTGDGYINPTPAIYDNGTHPRNVSQIKSISIHHDAMNRPHDYDSVKRYYGEAAAHYQRLGPGLQYHYKIDNTGVIFKTRPLDEWLYCVGSPENVTTIAICLDGYLHNDNTNQGQDATREQYEALYQLLEELCERHPEFLATWPDVRPHADFSSTACCGNRLTGHVYPIQDKATAQAQLLNQGVFDWPSFQPGSAVVPPTPAPTPAPPVPVPTPPSNPADILNPPVPVIPPLVPENPGHDYTPQLNRIEAILIWLQDLLGKIFK